MPLYPILSALLGYPEQDLLDALPEIDAALAEWPQARDLLAPVTGLLRGESLIALQENYVATFDRSPAHSLHLFEHVHGESRDRGQAMVDLIDEYRREGFEPAASELPDYVPLFLEFLGALVADDKEARAEQLLGEAIHVLAAIGERLARNQSPYAGVFAVLRTLTNVQPQPQQEPPVRDMDEALETFGPGADGVEPLLAPQAGPQAVQFYRRDPRVMAPVPAAC